MGNLNLDKIKDKKIAKRLEGIFGSSADIEGDFLSEEIPETLDYTSLYQPTTRSVEPSGLHAGMQLGDIYSKATGVIGKKISVAVLAMWNTRSYYMRDRNEQLCSSPNGSTPIHTKFATKCINCRYAKFRRGKPSECTKFINFLVMPENFDRKPFVIQFSRTGYRIGLDIAKQIKDFGGKVYSKVFVLESERAKDAAYYKYKVIGVRDSDAGVKPGFEAILDYYRPIVESSLTRHEIKEEEDDVVEEVQALENVE